MIQLSRLLRAALGQMLRPAFCWCIPADHDPAPCRLCQVLDGLINGVLVPLAGAMPVLVLALADRSLMPWWGAGLAAAAGCLAAIRAITVAIVEAPR